LVKTQTLLPEADARIEVPLTDGQLWFWPSAFDAATADRFLAALRSGIAWQQEEILIFGERRRVPRLVAWHGDTDATYVYSGTRHDPRPWTADLQAIRVRVESLTGHSFNAVLLNRYRDGRDGMGWHADDEPELGPDPVIASVSFGATRRFRLRHRRNRAEPVTLPLEHGSLLLMAGATQRHWLHAVPKTVVPVGERINLTFRRIVPPVLRQ
jgi:alkylated DNA repair dioxygenase AlkB